MNVIPVKLAYRGVLIERPCLNCDTVNFHFEGRCNDLCLGCGGSLYYHAEQGCSRFRPQMYYPADFDVDAPAFIKILDKVKEIGQPEHYTSDLFRDYQRIVGIGHNNPIPAERFVWAVRHNGCGTDLFTPEVGIDWYYTNNSHMAYFVYDGESHGPLGDFPEVDINTARTILSVWRAEELAPVQRSVWATTGFGTAWS